MKPFEERYTAWVDGLLAGDELAQFELELACHSKLTRTQAEEDRREARRLGNFLRTHSAPAAARSLANAEFFASEVLRQIANKGEGVDFEPQEAIEGWRWVWAGAGFLAIAAVLFVGLVIPSMWAPMPQNDYFAQILNAQGGEGITVVAYHDTDANVTVLWLDGMDYMPKEKRK